MMNKVRAEYRALTATFFRWVILGSMVGMLAGSASALFLILLGGATAFRVENPSVIVLLPATGLLIGWIYTRFAGPAARGNNLVIEAVNVEAAAWIPLRMAPMVLLGTILTHLFGGSAGREGTAIQMGSSLADWLRRILRLSSIDRRLMIMAGISSGFGSVFGTPTAGFVFGLEVQRMGRIQYEGIIPCLAASVVGDLVTRAWGAGHTHYPHLPDLPIDSILILKIAIAGVGFGLASLLFVELTEQIRRIMRRVRWQPLRPFIGGIAILVLTLLLGTPDYLGLSLPLIVRSVEALGVDPYAFLLKIVFTAVTIGTGFLGGEVTPLFVIGSTLGYTLGTLLGVDPGLMASVGMVAVFAGASNTPLACMIMGLELFGGAPIYMGVGCTVAYIASGHRGIYVTQPVSHPKAHYSDVKTDETLADISERRI
jgi:H+/Cl- antiporter ClcA